MTACVPGCIISPAPFFCQRRSPRNSPSLVEAYGGKRSDLFKRFVRAMERTEGAPRKLVVDFVHETRNESFETREAMIEYYQHPENLERLKRSEIGDNLERDALPKLPRKGLAYTYRAEGTFKSMDAFKDQQDIEVLCANGEF